MSKVEEYKQKEAAEHNGWSNTDSFRDGFNSCLALDLPVKFAEWYKGIYDLHNPKDGEEQAFAEMNFKELYQYWIENVYNPEP